VLFQFESVFLFNQNIAYASKIQQFLDAESVPYLLTMKDRDIVKEEFKIYDIIVFTKGNKQIFNYYTFDIKYNFIHVSLRECLNEFN
jgi:galactitol-specific phosphotransferase system IIB component